MRVEIQNWIDQSSDDFDGAKFNFNGERYYIAAFLCQQAVEKALKALFLYEKKGEVPQSHSLIYLATNTSIPKDFYSFLKELPPSLLTLATQTLLSICRLKFMTQITQKG